MSKILVTGGAGFIGSTLCEKLLEYGHKVLCLDNFNDYYDPSIKERNVSKAKLNQNYTLIKGDIRDDLLLKSIFTENKVDVVVHLAALAGVRSSIKIPLEYVDIDIKGTVSMLEFSVKHNVKKFIFASSSSVYGRNQTPFKEDCPISFPLSPYAAAKISGEFFCRTYNSLYRLPVVALRFFTVYGPRQRPEMTIHNFTKLIDEGKIVSIFGDAQSSRDYTYIDDIVDGIIASIKLQCSFEVFNLGNSTAITLNQLIDIIEKKVGKNCLKNFLRGQAGDVPHTLADISKAKSMLNYNPKVSIEEGIGKFVQWYRESKK